MMGSIQVNMTEGHNKPTRDRWGPEWKFTMAIAMIQGVYVPRIWMKKRQNREIA